MFKFILLTGVVALGLAAGPVTAAPATPALIADALGAAPAAVARGATVMAGDKVLRKGSNGWTCMPDNPATPGRDPMCLDKNGLGWAMAMMGHKTPPAGAVGMAYMLKGGSDANNVDPYAKHAAGKPWIVTGPHVMILSGDMARSSGYPAGTSPDTSKPYVMFAGTPYEHIMLPVR